MIGEYGTKTVVPRVRIENATGIIKDSVSSNLPEANLKSLKEL